ncbi:hypothetical protein [Adhaeribacter aquaticus]|uniref:hypothetical protein n=1 Tax=Adhaeribacter aquaticus TaxID=299567 RepID=UPI000429F761|nr:hypothetical protein [Adhaeribacter aquaticus]
MKHCYTLVIFLFIPFFIKAQSNYKKGLVVNTQGDTLRGFVDYREWDQNPRSFSFKSSEAGSILEFTPKTSTYFAIDGMAAYERYQGRISMNKVDARRLSTDIDTSTATVTAFLKILQNGKNVALYSYRDEVKVRFFLKQQNAAKPEELIFRRYLTNNGKTEVTNTKIYAAQLWNVANAHNQGTPELKRQVEFAQYTESDLLKIVSRINNISKQELANSKVTSSKTRFFAGVGINKSSFKSANSIMSSINNPAEVSYMPKVSIGADAFLNPDVQRVILRGQLSYSMASFRFASENAEYTLNQNSISALPQVLFNVYNKENFKFNVGGGVVFNYSSYPKNQFKREIKNSEGKVVSTTERNDLYYYKTLWYGFMVRTGIMVNNKVDLSVLYFPASTLAIFKVNTVHFEVNYLFNKKQ